MQIDISNPKITWTAIVSILTLAFSTGIAWISIIDNKETNYSQWRRINDLEKQTGGYEAMHNNMRAYELSINKLSEAVTRLTIVTEVSSQQAKTYTDQRSQDTKTLNQILNDMTNLKIKVSRIEEKILK